MRKSALAASGFALALALSACGGGGGEGSDGVFGAGGDSGNGLFSSPQALVQAAKEGTNESQSVKFTMELGASGRQMTATGEALFAGADTAMAISVQGQGNNVEMRMVDNTVYMNMPELASATGGKTWVKMSGDGNDTNQLAQQFGGTFDQSDPRNMLGWIEQAGDITKSEETTLDGQDVTHYWIDLDYAKIAEQVGPNAGVTKDQAKTATGKVGKLPMEVWLDGDNLPVQMSMDLGKVAEATGAPAQGGSSMVIKYTDWGGPVNVQAPPADQIAETPSF